MRLLAADDWAQIVSATILALPALIAAVLTWDNRRRLKTPSGTTIGKQVEQANAVSAVTLAHTSQILKRNGETVPAVDEALRRAAAEAPGLVGCAEPPAGGAHG